MAPNDGRGFYDATYGRFADELYAAIRRDAFGEEIGQNSWLTAAEHRSFLEWLAIDAHCHVLEIASGSGGPALFMAAETGCRVTGVDLHQDGVDAANAAARARGLAASATFLCGDARKPLPLPDGAFDAVVCIDAINHLYERGDVLREWHRVLRRGGRALFTDPITVTGMLRREEMIVRSGGMGEFVFTAPGEDARLLRQAGFDLVQERDATANMAQVAASWRASRASHRAELDAVEGAEANATFDRFLEVVALLAREQRLRRVAYRAERRN